MSKQMNMTKPSRQQLPSAGHRVSGTLCPSVCEKQRSCAERRQCGALGAAAAMAKGPTLAARAADSDAKARGDLQRKYYCPHGRAPSRCKDCGGSAFCEHGRRRSHCKQCGGSSFCEHLRQRSRCKECGTFPERAACLPRSSPSRFPARSELVPALPEVPAFWQGSSWHTS